MKASIPIFIISFNRLTVLQKSILSYLRFADYQDFVILDMSSTYHPLKEYYRSLSSRGATVIHLPPLTPGVGGFSVIGGLIEQYGETHPFDYYVVTDPDIAFDNIPADVLNVFRFFLDEFSEIDIVGPMLKITDLPEEYPAREWCWKLHAERFWHKRPESILYRNRPLYYQRALIDTTFGLLRRSTRYKNLLNGVRVYNPYEARHLDWYITPATETEDQKVYRKTANRDIAHWGIIEADTVSGRTLKGRKREIFVVEEDDGTMAIKRVALPESPVHSKWHRFTKGKLLP